MATAACAGRGEVVTLVSFQKIAVPVFVTRLPASSASAFRPTGRAGLGLRGPLGLRLGHGHFRGQPVLQILNLFLWKHSVVVGFINGTKQY